MEVKKCKSCGCDAMETGAPYTVLQFTIPFTQIEIIIWNWKVKDYAEYCLDCTLDMERSEIKDYTDEAYNAGFDDGYEKAIKDL